MELNKRKPYGTIGGKMDGFPGARYTQDGNFFNAAGDHLTGKVEVVPAVVTTEDEPPVVSAEPFNVLSLLDGTIPSIIAALPGLSDDEICGLYLAEIDGKTRSGLIKAIDEHRANAAV